MKYKRILSVIISASIMLLLIVDTETAKRGVADGISLCMNVIIPSLFPFFLVSSYLSTALLGIKLNGLRKILKPLQIPNGCESLVLLGFLGGYPVGAQLIAEAYCHKRINRRTARIMLGYCNNAGPAFIFGIAAILLSTPWAAITLWIIHILSALITAFLLPRPSENFGGLPSQKKLSLVTALKNSIVICAAVCGWIIIFKVIIQYLDRYLGQSSTIFSMIIRGILELSNGCLTLSNITFEPLRFLLCTVFLALGGVCVLMQTASATNAIGLGLYIPGKLIQACISLMLGLLFFRFLYAEWFPLRILLFILPISFLLIMLSKRHAEKSCGNPEIFHV